MNLSEGQKRKLAKAMKDGSPLTLRLAANQLVGNDELILTKTQVGRLNKAKQKKTGAEIKISKSQIRKAVKHGGSLWTSLLSLGTKALPFVTKGVSKVAPHLATGALSALGSLGIDKIFGKSGGAILPDSVVKMIQKGIEVPVKFLVNLINLDEILTIAQKTLIGKGIQSGRGIALKPTKKQIHGGLLGTLAAIGIPIAIELASKIFGKGLQVPRKAGMGLHVSPKPFLWQPSPFYGTWKGQGKGKKGKRASVGKKQSLQQHSDFGSVAVKPPWKDVPLSNFDLLEWVDYLNFPNFKGIFSRESKDHLHNTGCCIINLDDEVENGTHWVATDIKGKKILYFDSFSMPLPIEFVSYARIIGKEIVFNAGHLLQDIHPVRCGYYCLYFLNEIWRKSFYDVLSVFSLVDSGKNEKFVMSYFKKL